MKFNYYNTTSSFLLLVICLGPFLSTGIFFLIVGVGIVKWVAVILFFLFFVFLYKVTCMKVTIDEKGVLYKSLFKEKFLPWTAVKDVLIVVRERRSLPDYYKLEEWMASGRAAKNHFLLFRTTPDFPANPMFMFSAPVDEDYISVQCRNAIIKRVNQFYYST